jgi:hypothetical protein
MSSDRHLWAEFCDDVRQEVGNKISLMGCYGPDMLVHAFPMWVPKFCVVAKAKTPIDRPWSHSVVRVLQDDKVIAEMPFNPNAPGVKGPIRDGATWYLMQTVFILSPFQLDGPCTLRVTMESEGEEVSGSKLYISVASSQASSDLAQNRPPVPVPT